MEARGPGTGGGPRNPKKGQKMAKKWPKWPKMAKKGQKTPKIKGFLTLFWPKSPLSVSDGDFLRFRASPALG